MRWLLSRLFLRRWRGRRITACSGHAPHTGNIPEEPVFNGDLGLHSSAEKLWAAKGGCSDTQTDGSSADLAPLPLEDKGIIGDTPYDCLPLPDAFMFHLEAQIL